MRTRTLGPLYCGILTRVDRVIGKHAQQVLSNIIDEVILKDECCKACHEIIDGCRCPPELEDLEEEKADARDSETCDRSH